MESYIVKVNEYGTEKWYQDDKLHRINGLEVIHLHGYEHWYIKVIKKKRNKIVYG